VDRSGRDLGDQPKYIVRPLRHSGGQGYRLTDNPSDYEEGREYIQEVYPKNHEYRIIVVRGKPLFTLYKRRPETLTYEQPWNHANGSSFVTVNNPDNNRLRHTDVYERINNASGLLNNLDLVGIDVMYARRGEYVITEFNLCPAITLEHNLQKVAEHVNSDSFLSR
jgi:glutathione synthase/RimK-type ligase-like ATP-grasp enzyme